MAFPDIFKLEKLKIEAFADSDRERPVGEPFVATFNPESLSEEFSIAYRAARNVGGTQQPARIEQAPPGRLSVTLLLDGSGVGEIGLMNLFAPPPTVEERIKAFKALAYDINGEIHEPNYLLLSYGEIKYRGRLGKLTINRQSFDRQGNAVRAELVVELISDEGVEASLRDANLASPDVSHSRTLRAGDTLPMLSEEVYGSPAHHLAVARFNGIDHPRAVPPGTVLLFPPLPR
jgi:nucleoid-associated protein YgaU